MLALQKLGEKHVLYQPSIGAVAIDVVDVRGVMIASVEPNGPAAAGGVKAGDVYTLAKGQPTPDVAALHAVLASAKAGERIVLQGNDGGTALREAAVQLAAAPRVVSMEDQTVLFNKLVIDLRERLVHAGGGPEEAITRLNLAVALMAVENFREAREHLERVDLPRGSGVSFGTVQYLLGVTYEKLDLLLDAERAWNEAVNSPTSTLTEDGPTVAELAAARLKMLHPARRPAGLRDP
jgi:hypothetical protein